MGALLLLSVVTLASADAGVPLPELEAIDVIEVLAPPDDAQAPLPTSPLVRDPTAALTTVDVAERRAEAKDAAELVLAAPGAVVQDSGGPGQRKTLSLRGAAPNAVLVLLDGVPLASAGAAMDLSRIPTAALERLEVLRGAGGRYGPGGLGGVVNLVTRAPESQPHVFADLSHGSFETTRGALGATGPLLGGDALVLLHGLRSEGRFDYAYDEAPALDGNPLTLRRRENNGALQGGGLLRYRRAFGATRLDVVAEGLGEQRGLAGPVQNPSATAGQATWRGTLSARTQTRFDDGSALAVLGYGRVDATELTGTFLGAGYRQLESSAGAEATWTRTVAGRHGLTALLSAGGDWLAEPTRANPSWGRLGAMLGDEVRFFGGDLAVSGSARLDVAGPFVVVSPRLGATAQLPLGLSVRANVGQASRPPAFGELYVVQGTLLPNGTLRPERALTADLGVQWAHERALLAVTGFGALYEDLISYEYYPPNLARPFNFQAASAAGVEVEARVTPWGWLEASASYTFLSTQNLKDDPRYYLKALPFRPAHRVYARVAAGPEWLRARAEVLVQSEQFQNRTGTLVLPARAFVNAGVAVTPWTAPRVMVSAELKNLLDVQSQDVDGYPLPPRSFFVTLGLAWGGAKR